MELAQERKIEIEDSGEKLYLFFKELRSEEWLAFQREISSVNGDENDASRRRMLALVRARLVRIEGYTYNGEDLMAARPDDWRDFLPGGHLYLAWVDLVLGNDLKKKSEMRSEN